MKRLRSYQLSLKTRYLRVVDVPRAEQITLEEDLIIAPFNIAPRPDSRRIIFVALTEADIFPVKDFVYRPASFFFRMELMIVVQLSSH